MRASMTLVSLAVVAATALPGCGLEKACTLIGGFEGVGVEIPRPLFVRSGTATFEVCDADGCASATQRLPPVPEGRPVGRGVSVGFGDLGRSFGPGVVDVTVQVSGPGGAVVAQAAEEVELVRSYPNGRDCDGEGFVGGTFSMSTADASDRSVRQPRRRSRGHRWPRRPAPASRRGPARPAGTRRR